METIREVTEDEATSELDYYSSYQESDDIQQLRQEMRAEVLARQLQDETASGCCALSCSCYKCVKVVFLTTVIALVWAAMAVPSIYYVVQTVSTADDDGNSSRVISSTNCTQEVYSTNTSACIQEVYSGTLCRPHLVRLQCCIDNRTTDDGPVYISPSEDQMIGEGKVQLLNIGLQIIQDKITKECMEHLQPFVCLYLFPLASCHDGVVEIFKPSFKQCKALRDDVCKSGWDAVAGSGFRHLLPNCEDGEDIEPAPCRDLLETCQGTNNCSSPSNKTHIIQETPLNCSQDFNYTYDKETGSRCFPVCQKWSTFNATFVKISDGIIIATTTSALVVGLAVLVVSCLRYSRIFVFPSIFVVYQTITLMVLGLLILIGITTREKIYCSSNDTLESIAHPTPFCIISGVLFYYLILQLLVWWLCHITAVFHGTLFPFHMKRLKDSKHVKCIHATMVLLSLVLPVGPVVGVALIGGGYRLTQFPTIVCTGRNKHANFGFMTVPISIGLGAGATMLVFILWTVIKRHVQAHKNRLRVDLNWTAEAKVLSIFLYHIILGAAVLTIFTRSFLNVSEFFTSLTAYFHCEAEGTPLNATAMDIDDNMMQTSSCKDKRKMFQEFLDPHVLIVAFVIMGLYPLVNLIYIINVKELKKKCTLRERKVEVIRRSREERLNVHSVMRGANPSPVAAVPITFKGIGSDSGLINFNAAAASASPTPHIHVTSSFNADDYIRPTTFRPLPSQ